MLINLSRWMLFPTDKIRRLTVGEEEETHNLRPRDVSRSPDSPAIGVEIRDERTERKMK